MHKELMFAYFKFAIKLLFINKNRPREILSRFFSGARDGTRTHTA